MIILDAKAVMYHCLHIGKDPDSIISNEGKEINTAQFAFNNFMERYMLPILDYDAPQDILIAHDAGIEYRETLYPEYKKTKSRTEKDPLEVEEAKKLFSAMKKFWAAIGCTQAKVEGVEADDLIAYFCEKLEGNHDVYTVDADLLQLQGQFPNVKVLLKCEYQEGGSHQGVLYKYTSIAKSMKGDPSDNYKGIKGFGPSKWESLVEEFGYDGIDELIKCVDTKDFSLVKEASEESNNKALDLLVNNLTDWRLSWKLAQLHPELCWKPNKAKGIIPRIQWYKELPSSSTVASIFSAMGCSDLYTNDIIERILPSYWAVESQDVDEDLYTQFEEECKKSPVVAFDYETHPSDLAMKTDPKGNDFVDVKEALIAGASFTFGEALQNTIYIPVNHTECNNCDKSVIEKLLVIAENSCGLVVHNASFEVAVTKTNLDFWLKPLFDTAIMQSYVDENESAGLKSISKRLLNYSQASYKDTVYLKSEDRIRTMDELTLKEVTKYGCDDATVTAHIFVLHSIITKLEGSFDFIKKYETCSQHSLVQGYLRGTPLDGKALQAQADKDQFTIDTKTKRLRELLGATCSNPSEERIKEFLTYNKKYILKSARLKKKKDLEIKGNEVTKEQADLITEAGVEAFKKFKAKALRGSYYEPLVETVVYKEFSPTLTQLNSVVTKLGIETLIEKVTIKGLREWVSGVSLVDMESEVTNLPLTSLQSKFCDLLMDSIPQLKKKEGEAYEKFLGFIIENNFRESSIEVSGDELNVGSPIQMQYLLYCKLGLPIRLSNIVTKGSGRDKLGIRDGTPKTDSLAMDTAMAEDLTDKDDWRREALSCIKAVKSAKTRFSLYHTPYPLWLHPSDKLLHPQVRNCGTVTRRPTGGSPNVLQVSKHQEDAVMRSVFVPEEDELIVSIDFSQQELRIMGSEANDENLISCYVGDNPRDVHSMTAAGILEMDYVDYVSAKEDASNPRHKECVVTRKVPAKRTNFLFAYMGQASTLSMQLIIPYKDADNMLQAAFNTYSRVGPWQDGISAYAANHGYSVTAYGNRRHINDSIFSSNEGEKKRMERQAVNATIQSTAADILKIVLTNCWETNLWKDTKATLLAPVYDEITARVHKDHVVEYINRLVEIMEVTPPNHVIPMKADVSLGHNWRDQIEIGLNPSEEAINEAVNKALEAKQLESSEDE